MLGNHGQSFAETGDGFEDTDSNFHVVAHDLHFLRLEPADLIQNGRRRTDLPDVVQQPSAVHDLQTLGRQTHGMPQLKRQIGHALGVAGRPRRFRINRAGQGSERPQIQFFQCVDCDLQLVLLKACGVVLRDAGTKRGEECFLRHGLGEKPENLSLIHSSHGCFDVAVTGQHHTDGIR